MPALDGEYGVQPGHGAGRYRTPSGYGAVPDRRHTARVVVSDGFAEIMPDYCILLVSSAERPDEIDRARAERAKERAEERCARSRVFVNIISPKRLWPVLWHA